MILFFDTETTGLYDFKAGPLSESQPHLVQLACIGTDKSGEEVFQFDTLIKPTPDYTIPDGMIHGITHDQAKQYGVNGGIVATLFTLLIEDASRLVCHNYGFDSRIMTSFLMRQMHPPVALHQDKDYCTMMASTPYCKLPGKISGKWKWPRLSEAYEYFFPDEPVDFESQAHNALFDVRATKKIYFELMKRESITI